MVVDGQDSNMGMEVRPIFMLVFASNFIASGVFFGFILMKLKGLL